MPTMEVDGKTVSWEGKKTILQACLDGGAELPHYCYHPGLSIVASCRICLVEMETPDPKDPTKLLKSPKLNPSCQTPAVNGMKVYSESPKSVANQKAVMEFLLINHPLDCPVCDQAGECFLQDYSYQYGRSQSRFDEDKIKNPKKIVGEHVVLYSDRCILCTRCVRFTREISGTAELAVFGRGAREEIDVFPGKPIDNPLSGNVVDICPVGALLDRDFLFSQRVWFLKSTPSVSPFSSAGENIYIHHNRGRVYRIKPRFNADVNKWWISDDVRYGWNFVHENRLQSCRRAQYGSNVETSWDHALAQTGEDLRKASAAGGPGATAAVLSPFSSTEEMFLQARYARSVDPAAWLVLNPPFIDGADKVFKNPTTGAVTFTIRAERAPNRKGAEKVIAHFAGNTCDLAALGEKIKAKSVTAAVAVADPLPQTDAALAAALDGCAALIMLSPRKTGLCEKATLCMPSCTWAEKSGVYENFDGRIQPFEQAIAPVDGAKPDGEIFWELLAMSGAHAPPAVRQHMADAGLHEYAGIARPPMERPLEVMEYSEL